MVPDCLYLGLGGNLPGTRDVLGAALDAITAFFPFQKVSSLYLTEPQDFREQEPFLNIVASFQLPLFLTPAETLQVLLKIELQLGRKREGAIVKGPRLIDIDLLLFGSVCYHDEKLTVPHLRMNQRRFVLEPLLEIAPELVDPCNGSPYLRSLESCGSQTIYSKTPLRYNLPSI